MTASLRAHCILTEPVCKTMSGKGREGKGREQGREECGDLSPHRLVGNARVRDVMVSATRIDTDLTTIEHLDFEHAPPCEHFQHADHHADEPAAYVIEDVCPKCSHVGKGLICNSGWVYLCGCTDFTCQGCGYRSANMADFRLRIVEVLR